MADVIRPNLTGVVLKPGGRYMVDTSKKDKKGLSPLLSYDQRRIDANPDYREWSPTYVQKAPKAAPVVENEVLEDPIVIEDVVIEIDEAPAETGTVAAAEGATETPAQPAGTPREATMRAVAQKPGKKLTVRRKK